MKITADRDTCIGAGMCALTAPDVFDQDEEEGKVVLLDETPADPAKARRAAQVCPSGAIEISVP